MEGHIYIYGEITSYQGDDAKLYGKVSPRDVLNQIQSNKEAESLLVHINSPGGSVDGGFAIYDILKSSGKEVNTIAEGQCYSMATIVLSAGVKRMATQNSEFLPHNPKAEPMKSLDASGFQKYALEMKKFEDKMANHYAATSNITYDIALEEMKKDTFMDLETAKNYGFITEIVETVKAVAKFNINEVKMSDKKEKKSFEQRFRDFFAIVDGEVDEVKAVVVKTALGKDLDFYERMEGQITVGDKATLDGTTPNGDVEMDNEEVYTFKNGVLESIKEAEQEQEEEREEVDVEALVDAKMEAFKLDFQATINAKDETIAKLEEKVIKNTRVYEGLKGIVSDSSVKDTDLKEKASDKLKTEAKNVLSLN